MIEVRKQLYEMCDKTNTSRSGMDHLVNYYIKSLGWSEEEACKYALSLFALDKPFHLPQSGVQTTQQCHNPVSRIRHGHFGHCRRSRPYTRLRGPQGHPAGSAPSCSLTWLDLPV